MHHGEWPVDVNASRFAAGIERAAWPPEPGSCANRVGLLGLPDDLGVQLNHGRPGAAEGPTAFRGALARYGALESEPAHAIPRVVDFGDALPLQVAEPAALDETHRRVTAAARAIAESGYLPVAIGGGHDLTFAFVRGVLEACGMTEPGSASDQGGPGSIGPRLSGVYFDAHLDVRAEPGSGMPFRRLIEACGVGSLTVCGLDELSNTREHATWFQEHGGRRYDGPPESFAWPSTPTFVSFDLDVIDQAFAPGVSAMSPCGWTPDLAARWCRAAGRNPTTICFDIMELSPVHDERGRTARLAARLFLEFLRGVSERGTPA